MRSTFCLRLSAVVLVTMFAVASANAADTRESQRLAEGKITKNEAQHLVLKKYPDATIKSCVLSQSAGHGVWVIVLVTAGGSATKKITVDGLSGKLLP